VWGKKKSGEKNRQKDHPPSTSVHDVLSNLCHDESLLKVYVGKGRQGTVLSLLFFFSVLGLAPIDRLATNVRQNTSSTHA
jgi:hypothetical protein